MLKSGLKYFSGLVLVLPIVAAFSLSKVVTPQFESTAILIINPNRAAQAFSATQEERMRTEQLTFEQVVRSQISIMTSEDVLWSAVKEVGKDRLFPEIGQKFDADLEQKDAILRRARESVSVGVENNTFVVKISARNPDRELAAKFANAVASEFLTKRAQIYSNPEASSFFSNQEVKYKLELETANRRLEEFSKKNSIWSIEDQRRLALERRDAAATGLSGTDGLIAQKDSESASVKSQILALRTRMSLPAEIFGPNSFGLDSRMPRAAESLSSDPPLIHVKLYQTLADRLVAVNAELSGLKSLREQQRNLLKDIELQLDKLAMSESEFARLRRQAEELGSYIKDLSKRSADASINAAWGENGSFSSVQIIQKASISAQPAFPKPAMFIAVGTLIGLLGAASILFISASLSRGVAPVQGLREVKDERLRKVGG